MSCYKHKTAIKGCEQFDLGVQTIVTFALFFVFLVTCLYHVRNNHNDVKKKQKNKMYLDQFSPRITSRMLVFFFSFLTCFREFVKSQDKGTHVFF